MISFIIVSTGIVLGGFIMLLTLSFFEEDE